MADRDAAWVGWAGEPGPAPEPFYQGNLFVHPVHLTSVEIEEYYEGFSNDTLWPIYHDVIVQATFHRHWWNTYRTINDRFAQAIAEVAAPGATVRVHDYHLQLGAGDVAGDPTRPAHRMVLTTYPSRRSSSSPSCHGVGRWSRACWARTSWASSAPPMPRTSCVPVAVCWGCPPRAIP